MERERFIVGINYWPASAGLYWWRMFAPAQVKKDFSLLAEYRFDVARIFLMWEDFQPGAGMASVRAIDNLVQVADIAQDRGLQILPTFFCGHLLGMNWVPDWLVLPGKNRGFPVGSGGKVFSSPIRNMFMDREVRQAQKLLIHEVANALQGHPAVGGWDLGNQISHFAAPPPGDRVRAWFEEMINELKRRDAHLPITSAFHQRDLESAGMRWFLDAAPYCDFLSLQILPPYPAWADAPPDPFFPVFLCRIAGWLSGKDVILGSLGLPVNPSPETLSEADLTKSDRLRLFSEDDAERHIRQVLDLLRQNKAKGALAWCFADLDSSLWDKPPFDERVSERFYGFFRVNGSAKRTGKIAAEFPRQPISGAPDATWIGMDLKEYYENPSQGLRRLYGKFKDRFGA